MPGFNATPADYSALGFRIIPVNPKTKAPRVDSFGKDTPDFTIPPENFRTDRTDATDGQDTDYVAILCGPCPAFAADGDWLMVLDVDKGTTFADVERAVGVPLPSTLSSKGDAHRYYRVPAYPSGARDAIRQWVRVLGKDPGAPALDMKWAGGYAIEPPEHWDAPFSVEAIATLPEAWLMKVLALRAASAKSKAGARAPAPEQRMPMGAVDPVLIQVLAACWPRPGEGCHEAALALGGILGESWWSEDDIARFSSALFAYTNTKDRTADVLYSTANRRAEGECKGWPTLAALLKEAQRAHPRIQARALQLMKLRIPGLRPPKIDAQYWERYAQTAAARAR